MKLKFLESTENSNINPHLGQHHISYSFSFNSIGKFEFSFRFPLRKILKILNFEKIREIFKYRPGGCFVWSVLVLNHFFYSKRDNF